MPLGAGAQIRIMPLGDSITRGVHGSDPIGGYRDDLFQLLTDEGIFFDLVGTKQDGDPSRFDVDHEGHGGWKADNLLMGRSRDAADGKLDDWLAETHPDMVLLHIGTNDVSSGESNSSTVYEIETILNRIHDFDNHIKILLSSVIPRRDSLNAQNDALNVDIQYLYFRKKSQGLPIYYVPQNERFVENANWAADYLADVVHPNNRGYALMAQVWFESILQALDDGYPSVTLSKISGDGQTGEINRILPVSVAVQALDPQGNPVSNVLVDFRVTEGRGTIQPAQNSGLLFVEAEASDSISSPMKIWEDSRASGNFYIASEETKRGAVDLKVFISETGNYRLWGRIYALSGEEDSFFLSVDDSPDTILWDIGPVYNQWLWLLVSDRDRGEIVLPLSAGEHVLHFYAREKHSRLDKLCLTKDENFTPHGRLGFSDAIRTDTEGRASIRWLLGPVVGTQVLEVRCAIASNSPQSFEAQAVLPSPPGYYLNGQVLYAHNGTPVPGVQLMLNDTLSGQTDSNGHFHLAGLPGGEYLVIVPAKKIAGEGESFLPIMYDAAIIARQAVGLDSLSPLLARAADVDGDGQVLMYDAAQVARFVVGLPVPNAVRIGQWAFSPDSIVFNDLEASIDNFKIQGLPFGDMHGGWSLALTKTAAIGENIKTLVRPGFAVDTVTICLPVAEAPLYSVDLQVIVEGENVRTTVEDSGLREKGFHVFSNVAGNEIRIGAFSPKGIKELKTLPVTFLVHDIESTKSLEIAYQLNATARKTAKVILRSKAQLPVEFSVSPVYPNPFNMETAIRLHLPQPAWVQFLLFDLQGRMVRKDEIFFSNNGVVTYPVKGEDAAGRPLASGQYFLKIIDKERNIAVIRKLTILK